MKPCGFRVIPLPFTCKTRDKCRSTLFWYHINQIAAVLIQKVLQHVWCFSKEYREKPLYQSQILNVKWKQNHFHWQLCWSLRLSEFKYLQLQTKFCFCTSLAWFIIIMVLRSLKPVQTEHKWMVYRYAMQEIAILRQQCTTIPSTNTKHRSLNSSQCLWP